VTIGSPTAKLCLPIAQTSRYVTSLVIRLLEPSYSGRWVANP